MKKFNMLISVLLATGLLMALPAFAAAKDYSKSWTGESKGVGRYHAFNWSDLMGKTVKNHQGEELGKVEDMIFGRYGNPSFVVLSRGETAAAGSKYVPVPFKTFMSSWTNKARIDKDSYVIARLDKAKLDSAPTFSDKKDLSGKAAHDKVCTYYGRRACPHRFM